MGFNVEYDTLYTFTAESNYQLDIDLFNKRNTFLAGVEYRRHHQRTTLHPNDFWAQFFWILFDWDVEEDTWSMYLQDEIRVTDSLLFNIGARFDIISTDYDDRTGATGNFDTTHHKWSPRIGFTYAFKPYANLFGNYTEGVRTVMTSMNSFDFNKDLDPEREKSYELGIRGRLLGRMNYSIAGFYIKSKDKIIDTGGRFFTENAGEAKSKGVEMAFHIDLPYGFYTALDYTYQDAEFDDYDLPEGSYDDKNVPLVPENLFGANLGWQDTVYGRIDCSLHYSDTRYIDRANDLELDEFTVVNLKYSKKWKSLEFTLSAVNIFDKAYAEFGETNGGAYVPGPVAYPADGRSFYAHLRYKY